jgi:hypothetical protein
MDRAAAGRGALRLSLLTALGMQSSAGSGSGSGGIRTRGWDAAFREAPSQDMMVAELLPPSRRAVYRAERVGFRRSQPGALKVSLEWLNGRMEREVQLLSRLNHPSISRNLGHTPSFPVG